MVEFLGWVPFTRFSIVVGYAPTISILDASNPNPTITTDIPAKYNTRMTFFAIILNVHCSKTNIQQRYFASCGEAGTHPLRYRHNFLALTAVAYKWVENPLIPGFSGEQ
jgi:hypothetical protein